MSDNDHVMASADTVAPKLTEARIVADLEKVWECIDGPQCAYVEWEHGPVIDPGPFQYRQRARAIYASLAYGVISARGWGTSLEPLGASDLSKFHDWFPDVIRQAALRAGIPTPEEAIDNRSPDPVAPDTHMIVWRIRPEIEWHDPTKAWHFYCRFAFVPKGATIIPLED